MVINWPNRFVLFFLDLIQRRFRGLQSFLALTGLKLRLTLLYSIIFGASFLVLAVITSASLQQNSEKDFDDALYNYAVDVFDKITLSPSGDFAMESPFFDREKIYPFALGTALIQIRNASGRVISEVGDFGQYDLPFEEDRNQILLGRTHVFRQITPTEALPNAEAQTYRMITVPIDDAPRPALYLQIAVPRNFLENVRSKNLRLLAWLLPLSLLVSGGFGYWIAGRALQSIRSMTAEVRRISPQDLHTRVSIPAAKGELQDLAQTMNELLNRIERAFVAQERFVADASHQLQTPLALIRAEIESEGLKNQLLPSSMRSVLQEVEHMSRLIKDLLMLARAEAGGGSLAVENFFLDEIVLETLSRLDSVFKKKSIRLMFNIQENLLPRRSLRGDPELMSTLIFSLLENAAKYSPPNGQVSCTIEFRDKSQELIVRDEGPGIPSEELNQVFDRFHRGFGQTEPGHGLGLAIAKKVADAHRAKLWVENHAVRGAAFHFEMPLSDAEDSATVALFG